MTRSGRSLIRCSTFAKLFDRAGLSGLTHSKTLLCRGNQVSQYFLIAPASFIAAFKTPLTVFILSLQPRGGR
ncbi:MAG: hypothetical protein PsegKO_22160 [Pseudohongiellaceae bacterium]